MNDLQKKIDELTALRDTLVKLTNTVNLTDTFSINSQSVYTGKIQTIAKKHQQQIKENATIFNNSTYEVKRLVKESQRSIKESRRLVKESQKATKESQRLAKESRLLVKESQKAIGESRRLVKESQQLAKTNTTSFKNKNNIITKQSIEYVKILINKIDIDINIISEEKIKLITMDKIRNLCESTEFIQTFSETYIATGMIKFNNDMLTIILTAIKSYCDWHYPGLQCNPMSKYWIDCMVTADPLYLIDHKMVFIGDTEKVYERGTPGLLDIISDYPEEYQRRLRIYNMRDQDFSSLPQEQFGIITCCDFLNFFKLNFINNYISTFFKLLRPGGKLVCTIKTIYPDGANILIEREYFKYASNLVIQKIFKNAGYEIQSITDLIPNNINWECIFLIEVYKPGVLATSKAHQVLGSIIEK